MQKIFNNNIIVLAMLFAIGATAIPMLTNEVMAGHNPNHNPGGPGGGGGTPPQTSLQIDQGTFTYLANQAPTVSGIIEPVPGTAAPQFQSQCAGNALCLVEAQLGLEGTTTTSSGYNIVNPHTGENVGPEGGPRGLQSESTGTTTNVYSGEQGNLDPVCAGGAGGLNCADIPFTFPLELDSSVTEPISSSGNTHAQPNENAPFEPYSNSQFTDVEVIDQLTHLLLTQKDAIDQSQDYTVAGLP